MLRQEDGANTSHGGEVHLQRKRCPTTEIVVGHLFLSKWLFFIYTFRNDWQDQANQKKGDRRNDI